MKFQSPRPKKEKILTDLRLKKKKTRLTMRMSSDFSVITLEASRQWRNAFKIINVIN